MGAIGKITFFLHDIAPNQLILYNYDVNFYEYFMNFPNFSAVTSFYRTCADELNINYMFFILQ